MLSFKTYRCPQMQVVLNFKVLILGRISTQVVVCMSGQIAEIGVFPFVGSLFFSKVWSRAKHWNKTMEYVQKSLIIRCAMHSSKVLIMVIAARQSLSLFLVLPLVPWQKEKVSSKCLSEKKMVALLETQQFQQMNPGGWIGTWADVGFMWATLRRSITLGWSIKNRDTSCCTHTHSAYENTSNVSRVLEALSPCYIIDWKTNSQF